MGIACNFSFAYVLLIEWLQFMGMFCSLPIGHIARHVYHVCVHELLKQRH